MIFTEKDIARILGNVDVSIVRLVARVLGRDFLKQADLDILKKHKVDILKLIPKFPSYYQAFAFGRISAALGDRATSRITYPEFKEFLSKMGDFALRGFVLVDSSRGVELFTGSAGGKGEGNYSGGDRTGCC